jgi:hypothetical protein
MDTCDARYSMDLKVYAQSSFDTFVRLIHLVSLIKKGLIQ